jgi:hypothetical protein
MTGGPRRLVPLAMALAGCPKADLPIDGLEDPASTVELRPPEDVLADGLASEMPSLRAQAVRAAIAAAHDPASAVGRGAWDPDAWTQQSAILSAEVRLSEPGVRDVIAAHAARDVADPYARALSAGLLARSGGSTEAADALRAACVDRRNAEFRAPLCYGAAILGHDEAKPGAVAALARADVGVEVAFLREVGRSGDVAFVEALRAGEANAEPELAVTFAAARLALGDPDARSSLMTHLRLGDVETRLAVIDAVALLPGRDVDLVLAAAAAPAEVRLYGSFVEAAHRGRISSKVERGITHEDPAIRALAVEWAAEAALRDAEVVDDARDVARRALSDEAPAVRRAAVDALGRLGLGDADRGAVRAALTDEAARVRIAAAGALLRRTTGG